MTPRDGFPKVSARLPDAPGGSPRRSLWVIIRVSWYLARGCQSNFEGELAKYGLGAKDMAANINFFMYVPVAADGAVAIADGRSKPGDYVDLRAEMDVLAVLSNCPETDNLAAGGAPTPVRAIVYTPG